MITITPGHKVQGTNPATGRSKLARGTGRVVRTRIGGFHGPTTVVLWTNGVESYHSANLDNSCVQGLPTPERALMDTPIREQTHTAQELAAMDRTQLLIQLPSRVRSLVRAVRAHAEAHYEQGWDVVVECYSNHDLAQIIGGARTPKGAIARVARIVEAKADRRAEHNAEAQAATGGPDTLHYHLPEDLRSEGHQGCACGAVFPTNRALDLHVAEARIAAGDYNPFEQGHHPDGSRVSWRYDEHGGDHWAIRTWPGRVGHGTIQIVPTEDGYHTVEVYTPGWRGEYGLASPNWCDGPVPF